jgi:hypothetical protein
MRLGAFIVALLLLAGTVDPTQGWLIALTVITGIAVMRPRFGRGLSIRPAIDVRLAAFVLSVLLLAGTIEPTKDWLIGLTIATGIAMVAPKIISVDLWGERERRRERFWAWTSNSRCASKVMDGDWGREAEREWRSWGGGRRRAAGASNRGDDWP